MKKHILEVDGIQKKYSHKAVLSDVYLKCETGEVLGMLGRNGSGKSTLLRIIFGLVAAPINVSVSMGFRKTIQQIYLSKLIIYIRNNLFRTICPLKKQ